MLRLGQELFGRHLSLEHQRYGTDNSREFQEPWLDEGFTRFITRWYMTERYGPGALNPDDLPDYARWARHTPARDRQQLEVLRVARQVARP